MIHRFHPAIPAVADRIERIQKALRDGKLSASDSAFLREGYVTPYKDHEGNAALSYGRTKAAEPELADDDEASIPFTVTTLDEDRDGDIVFPMGCQLENYSRNPIVFFGHQEWLVPIGVCRSPDGRITSFPEENRVRDVVYFDKPDSDAMFIYGKCKRKILNATSIAFVPIVAYRRNKEDERRRSYQGDKAEIHGEHHVTPLGWYFKEWDKTELSIVGVPSNPNAVGEAKDWSGYMRDILDQEKSFMSPRLQKGWNIYAAQAKGCWNGWCPPGTDCSVSKGPFDTGARNVASRITGAENRFIEFAMETAELSRPEAERALARYKKDKAIKIDPVGGQFTFTHGGFSEPDVLRRAAGKSATSVQKYITHTGSSWVVHAESGKVLGKHPTKEQAESQLRAVEASKHGTSNKGRGKSLPGSKIVATKASKGQVGIVLAGNDKFYTCRVEGGQPGNVIEGPFDNGWLAEQAAEKYAKKNKMEYMGRVRLTKSVKPCGCSDCKSGKACPCGSKQKSERFTDWKQAHTRAQELANQTGQNVALRKVSEFGKAGFNVSLASGNDSDYDRAEIVRPMKSDKRTVAKTPQSCGACGGPATWHGVVRKPGGQVENIYACNNDKRYLVNDYGGPLEEIDWKPISPAAKGLYPPEKSTGNTGSVEAAVRSITAGPHAPERADQVWQMAATYHLNSSQARRDFKKYKEFADAVVEAWKLQNPGKSYRKGQTQADIEGPGQRPGARTGNPPARKADKPGICPDCGRPIMDDPTLHENCPSQQGRLGKGKGLNETSGTAGGYLVPEEHKAGGKCECSDDYCEFCHGRHDGGAGSPTGDKVSPEGTGVTLCNGCYQDAARQPSKSCPSCKGSRNCKGCGGHGEVRKASAFKAGDKVVPLVGAFKGEEATVTRIGELDVVWVRFPAGETSSYMPNEVQAKGRKSRSPVKSITCKSCGGSGTCRKCLGFVAKRAQAKVEVISGNYVGSYTQNENGHWVNDAQPNAMPLPNSTVERWLTEGKARKLSGENIFHHNSKGNPTKGVWSPGGKRMSPKEVATELSRNLSGDEDAAALQNLVRMSRCSDDGIDKGEVLTELRRLAGKSIKGNPMATRTKRRMVKEAPEPEMEREKDETEEPEAFEGGEEEKEAVDEPFEPMPSAAVIAHAHQHAKAEDDYLDEELSRMDNPNVKKAMEKYREKMVTPRMEHLEGIMGEHHPDHDMEKCLKAIGAETDAGNPGEETEVGEANKVDAGEIPEEPPAEDEEAEPFAGEETPEEEELEHEEMGKQTPPVGGETTDPASEEILERYHTPKGWKTRSVGFLRKTKDGRTYLVRKNVIDASETGALDPEQLKGGNPTCSLCGGGMVDGACEDCGHSEKAMETPYNDDIDEKCGEYMRSVKDAADFMEEMAEDDDVIKAYRTVAKHHSNQLGVVHKALSAMGKVQRNGGSGSTLTDEGTAGNKGSMSDKGETQANHPTGKHGEFIEGSGGLTDGKGKVKPIAPGAHGDMAKSAKPVPAALEQKWNGIQKLLHQRLGLTLPNGDNN